MMRRADRIELWLTGFALMFVVTSVVLGQSQDAINATLLERYSALSLRIDKLENYLMATIVALISNLIAHVVSIKSQQRRRG